jgi:hypothetical protein
MGILGCTLKYIYIILYLQPLDTLENLWQRPGALLHVWWFTSPLRRDGEITSPGLGEPWLVIQRCWLPWLLGWSPRVCRVATFIGSVGYELQPIFLAYWRVVFERSLLFGNWAGAWKTIMHSSKNDDICYNYSQNHPKPEKTRIHSSKIDGLELYTRYWPWPMWVISWHWFPPIRSGDRYYGQEASEISPNPSCVFFVVHRRTQGGFTVTYVL